MPLQIKMQDITKAECDAIVNPTDNEYSGSGGTDMAIHTAAGSGLSEECEKLPPLSTGDIAVTGAYNLPSRYVFHTVGPVWHGGMKNENALLRSCYINALLKASAMGLNSIAFPLISSGTFGFPRDRVLRIASEAISDYLLSSDSELDVHICIVDKRAYDVSGDAELRGFIGGRANRYERREVESCEQMVMCSPRRPSASPSARSEKKKCEICENHATIGGSVADAFKAPQSLEEFIAQQDDTFAVMLMKLIEKKKMTPVECYKKANVSKGTFWKIKNDPDYRPSRVTIVSFAIALELTLGETNELLLTTSYSLSRSNMFDMIIRFYITKGIYDSFIINEALFKYDQPLLGC